MATSPQVPYRFSSVNPEIPPDQTTSKNTSEPPKSEGGESGATARGRGLSSPDRPILVHRHISQKLSFIVYPRSLVVDPGVKLNPGKRGRRGVIDGFSNASRRRLQITASNASPALISQFGMTYHKRRPSGPEVKQDLNTFLTGLRSNFPEINNLWILEFQERGVIHIHLYLTAPATVESEKLWRWMCEAWHRIAEADSPEHLWWHMRRDNFIPWDMGSGSYLCKYLSKEKQKEVPDGFGWVGRFWGHSRGLVPKGKVISAAELDDEFALVVDSNPSSFLIRTLCRAHSARLRKYGRRSRARRAVERGKYTFLSGGLIFDQVRRFWEVQPPF